MAQEIVEQVEQLGACLLYLGRFYIHVYKLGVRKKERRKKERDFKQREKEEEKRKKGSTCVTIAETRSSCSNSECR